MPTPPRSRRKPISCAPPACPPSSRAGSPRSPLAISALVIADIAVGPRRASAWWAACSSRWLIASGSTGSAIASPRCPRADRWQIEARAALRDDVADLHRALHRGRAGDDRRSREPSARVDEWVAQHADAVGALPLGVVRDRSRRRVRSRHARCRARESSASCASSAELSGPADRASRAVREQRRARRIGAARPVDAATRVRRGRREEQPAHRRLGATEPGHRPEDELLRERHRAAAERAPDEVRVARFERGRRQEMPCR